MNLKLPFKFVLVFALPFVLKAQKLTVGQILPEIELSGLLNYHSDKLKISSLNGKVIIFDFWNHYCTACIKSFPKLDSLQKAFKKDIQIILVNSESKDSTISFFKKRPRIKYPEVIMVTGDRKLREMFPAEGYPYCVWIDKSGVVRNFSGSYSVTSNSISTFLKGKDQYFSDPTLKRYGSPFSIREFKYLSYISQCHDILSLGNIEKDYANGNSIVYTSNYCSSIIELFKKAYSEKGKYNFNTNYGLSLELADSFKYIKPSDVTIFDTWSAKYGYNYELRLPRSKEEHIYKIMQEDLNRYFQLEAFVKDSLIKSVILEVVDSGKIKTKGGMPFNSLNGVDYGIQATDQYRYLRNQPFSILSDYLRLWIQYYYPFYSTVSLQFNIDIKIREESINPLNIENLNEDLRKAGLKLVFEERAYPVLHLKEKNN